jgi:hypothetical protein
MALKTRFACALLAAALTVLAFAGLADAQQATATPVVTVGTGAVQVIRNPMPLGAILSIALVAAFASAVNGLVGAIFLFVIWMWLYGGALPSINLYLREAPAYPWAPHLLLPLIVFLLFWQYRLRGKIGPSWGLRHLFRQLTSRGSRGTLAAS